MFAGTLAGQAFQALIITSGERERILINSLFVPMDYVNSLTNCLKKGAGLTKSKAVCV